MPPADISAIELSRKDLPSENVLRIWLTKLGCGKNTNKLAVMSRTYRVKHYITLNRNDTSNPDIIRVLEAYRTDKLSDYDKALLTLVGRSK